jgi:hypothetical protein
LQLDAGNGVQIVEVRNRSRVTRCVFDLSAAWVLVLGLQDLRLFGHGKVIETAAMMQRPGSAKPPAEDRLTELLRLWQGSVDLKNNRAAKG